MPEAETINTTPSAAPPPDNDEPATLEQLAALEFPALDTAAIDRALGTGPVFMECAKLDFFLLKVATKFLAFDHAGLADKVAEFGASETAELIEQIDARRAAMTGMESVMSTLSVRLAAALARCAATEGVLTSIAALAVAGPAVAAHPDAALIAECAAFVAAETQYRALSAAWSDTSDTFGWRSPEHAAADAALKAFSAVHHARLATIAATPARTTEGMQAKARAVWAFYEPDLPEADSVAGPALFSLVRDMAGVAPCS